jgi:hypothetical protein
VGCRRAVPTYQGTRWLSCADSVEPWTSSPLILTTVTNFVENCVKNRVEVSSSKHGHEQQYNILKNNLDNKYFSQASFSFVNLLAIRFFHPTLTHRQHRARVTHIKRRRWFKKSAQKRSPRNFTLQTGRNGQFYAN